MPHENRRYNKPTKTPLDVIAGWEPEKDFIEGAEKAHSERKKFKIRKNGL